MEKHDVEKMTEHWKELVSSMTNIHKLFDERSQEVGTLQNTLYLLHKRVATMEDKMDKHEKDAVKNLGVESVDTLSPFDDVALPNDVVLG